MRRSFAALVSIACVLLTLGLAFAQALTPQVYMPVVLNPPTNTPTVTPSATPTVQPTPTTQPTVQPTPTRNPALCAPEYPTVCIPPPPPDLDCGDIVYRRFTVLPPDRHQFDVDGDGIGCESG